MLQLQRFFQTEVKMLGRWARQSRKESNWKVDMANIDHCGTCGLEKKPAEAGVEFYTIVAEMSATPTQIRAADAPVVSGVSQALQQEQKKTPPFQ